MWLNPMHGRVIAIQPIFAIQAKFLVTLKNQLFRSSAPPTALLM